jgi:hypothetical protein
MKPATIVLTLITAGLLLADPKWAFWFALAWVPCVWWGR